MAAAKCASLAAAGAAGSTVVSLMARNGVEVGIQLAGLPGRWFTAPAAPVEDALLRDGYGAADAALDIGDSAVIECVGLGGMALGAAPAVAAFFGGDAAAAAARTELMAQICVARSERFTIAARRGTPWGSTRGWWSSSRSRRRSPPECCTPARAPGRSARAWPISRRSRSAPPSRRSPRRYGGRSWIGPGARRALREGERGTLAVVLARGGYVRLGDGWLLLAPPRAPLGPLSLLVEGLGALEPGAAARVSAGALHVGGARIDLAGARVPPTPRAVPLQRAWRCRAGRCGAAFLSRSPEGSRRVLTRCGAVKWRRPPACWRAAVRA